MVMFVIHRGRNFQFCLAALQAWHTAVLTQAYRPCTKLSRAFGATFTEWAISNRLCILHVRFLAFLHHNIF